VKKGNVEIQNAAELHYSGTFGYPTPFAKLWQWNKVEGNEKGKYQDVQLHIGGKLETNKPIDTIMTTNFMDTNEKQKIHYLHKLWPLVFYITTL